MISRQKLVGWILIAVAGVFLAYFLRTRVLAPGPVLERKEWTQLIGYIVILMIGTMNVRLAAVREQRRKGPDA